MERANDLYSSVEEMLYHAETIQLVWNLPDVSAIRFTQDRITERPLNITKAAVEVAVGGGGVR